MNVFEVETTSRFDRELKQLCSRHPALPEHFAEVLQILQLDPYNRSRTHDIEKLTGIPAGDAQYRIRTGRFRFRFDIVGKYVFFKACSLRREDTY